MTLIAKESGGTSTSVEADAPRSPVPPDGRGPESANEGQIVRLLAALVAITLIFLVAGLGDLLLFIVILIVIVMLHELAHFATAKWAGMQVTEYFVGFGPRLWSFRRGETEYGIKAIPAGGYVKITGFTVLDEVAEEDEARTYRQQPYWKRIIVASAGSAMHFIIAFVLALIVTLGYGALSNNQTVVSLDHWKGVAQTPAQQAGLRAGDTIVSFDGHGFNGANALRDEIGKSAGKKVTLGVERAGHVIDLTVTPKDGRGIEDSDGTYLAAASAKTPKGFIGFTLQQATTSVSPLASINSAASFVGSNTRAEVIGVGKIFSPSGLGSFYHQVTNSKAAAKASANAATDNRPVSLVGIASLGVQSQQQGLQSLLDLIILINIIFGLMNMLPMLPLDGGHVAVAVYEWIRTKKGQAYYRADITKMFPFVAVFLAFLAVIVLSALYLDITHPIQLPH